MAFLAVFLPLTALQYVANVEHSTRCRLLAQGVQHAQAHAATIALEDLFQDTIHDLLIARDNIQGRSNVSARKVLQSIVVESPECVAVGLIDANAHRIYRYPELDSEQSMADLSTEDLLANEAISSVSKLGDKSVFTVSTPVRLSNGRSGAIYAVISADAVINKLRETAGEASNILVLDRNKRTVCKVGNNISKVHVASLSFLDQAIPGRVVNFGENGESGCAVVSSVSGWQVVLFSPRIADSSFFSNINWSIWSIAVLLAAAVVVFRIGNHIASPIRKLSRAAEAVALGDLRRRIHISTNDELQSLAECFNQMTDGLEKQQRELQLTARVQQSLLDVGRTLTASLDLDKVATAIVDALKHQFGAWYAVIFRMDAATGKMERIMSTEDNDEDMTAKLLPIAEHTLKSPDVISSPMPVAYPGSDGEDSMVVMLPLVVGSRPVGVLAAAFPPEESSETELKDQAGFLRTFASSAAIAVHNAYIHGRTEELMCMLSSLRHVDEAISASLDLKQVFHSLVRITADVMSAKACAILLIGRDGRLSVAEAYNLSRELRERYFVEPGERWSGVVFNEKRSIYRTDIASEPDLQFGEIFERDGLHGFICAPLFVGDEAIGTINVLMDKPYTPKQTEIELLEAIASHAAVVIANAKLFHKEYLIAETLQSTLIGIVPDRLGRLVFGHKYLPALDEARVGGDLFDVMPLPNGKVALVVADVSGKGIQAAVHTAMIRYMTRAFIFQWPDSPATVLDLLNRSLFNYFGSKTIVTVFCAIIDPETGWMTYANAGHPPAIALTRSGKQQTLFYRTGIPIGYSEKSEYDERELILTPGDMLLLYTDGIIEARKEKNILTIEGLQDIVFKYSHLSPSDLVEMICEETGNFAGNNLQDDIAVIAATLEPHAIRIDDSRDGREESGW